MKHFRSSVAGLLACLAGLAAAHEGTHERLDRVTHSIETQPESQQLYLRRGRLYIEMERFDAAGADFDIAARLGPADLVAFDYGVLCYQMADMECALQAFNRYIKVYPGDAAAYEYRSRVYQQIEENSLALADLRCYFARSGNPAPGLYVSASLLAQEVGQDREGLSILDEGLARLGMVPQLQRRAVEIELDLGNTGAAIERWSSLREVLRDSVDWKIEMARLLMSDGRTEQAAAILREAKAQLADLRPTPARLKSGEAIAELELQMQSAA
jgi:tetratricopeptide (TPR) repeat protein